MMRAVRPDWKSVMGPDSESLTSRMDLSESARRDGHDVRFGL